LIPDTSIGSKAPISTDFPPLQAYRRKGTQTLIICMFNCESESRKDER
jgi:hypothetical protein